ncbi:MULTISPECIES: uroporphyrinogen-III C-methyltransferase [Rubrivivax]|uniref:uroporphyrinogen-III C-methyltransferase n=1 Tax=Rubrivivax benzoatilyticus TaxID=316997 RepID=A0ABX0HU12_9BURK|nr:MULTISPECIES: uroporphyrinogen-III C-methyltransferase [Rubrivivax]EGJ11867.1 uroporphyrin-III C-methyltransferase [Rubrivivax benzoatilyticus JA2 = ATCC BAA-35]MCC9598469.1 uroporphyrinogen-III C-methyltransferase [Rubrivivax sp. JA1055]MCC9648169.1 uroporphyrinogen-III C-methyltransferase [Rubrivivax sp. JA1029]NHK96894.1 uroporphyrinogen-III C-methyltransferase [Rubrivivax benzoatilyticus]NHL24609.1 uroporphyrinogen-III C-methyltransferase [Rubrivivax benzoatilyticus]
MTAFPEAPYLLADPSRYGHVTLLGAGPGDPELLTLKGAKALQRASLLLYDALVSEEILALAPPTAERLYVGKQASRHALPQEQIIELMLRLARSGRSLVRLKGGDGYIFGRGGEEAIALAEAGVPFSVIPGLSAAQGAGASAGIPLTHRDHAGALVFATGHLRADRNAVDLDWQALARPRQTLVIYMGVGTLPIICRELVAHGLAADTPAAIVERATLPDERCLTGTVTTLPVLAARQKVRTPALIVIGSVVGLRPLLAQRRREITELEACA